MTTNTSLSIFLPVSPLFSLLADSQSELISGGVIGTIIRRTPAKSSSPAPTTQPSSPLPEAQSPAPTLGFGLIPDFGSLMPSSFGGQFPTSFSGFTI